MVGALLCFAAAVLTMIGTFQDLVVVENIGNIAGSRNQTYIITLWEFRVEINGVVDTGEVAGLTVMPQHGVPLLFAVALLLAAALLGMLPSARPAARRFGLITVIAAAFLTAAVAMVVVQAMWWQEIFRPPVAPREGVDVEVTVGAGPALWTLIAGAALAIVAAVMAWRQPRPGPERVEPDTPRLGFPVVVRLPDEPQDPDVTGAT
jgi:hypothetical protein